MNQLVANELPTMAESSGTKKKRIRKKSKICFPQEILSEIFRRTPAPIVQSSFKRLNRECKEEANTPDFIKDHLSRAKPGLLIQTARYPYKEIRHFTIEKGVVKMKRFKRRPLPFDGKVLASCDGLSLVYTPPIANLGAEERLFLVNMVKKRVKTIPLLENASLIETLCSIGRVPATDEVKILCAYLITGNEQRWYIATVRHGQEILWNIINLNLDVKKGDLVNLFSISGVIYWAITKNRQDHNVCAINLSDESVHKIQVPNYANCSTCLLFYTWGRFLVMEGKFSMIAVAKESESELSIYVLSDLRSSQWEARNKFIHESVRISYMFEMAEPITWLDEESVLICKVPKSKKFNYGLVAYFVKTGKSRFLPGTPFAKLHKVTNYTSSLLWLS
ncbi:hypothetical protein QQ045_022166 [Rhodiola kirilowii]